MKTILLLIVLLSGPGLVETSSAQEFIKGVDATMLTAVERQGGTFSSSGQRADALAILRSKGVNAIRLRLFVDPSGQDALVCNLAYVLPLAQRVKGAGMQFLLDLHYSDSWADPGKQTKPRAWTSLGWTALQARVRDYTREAVSELTAAGASPDYVQIGNEINGGMLWPEGKTADAEGWKRFAELVRAGTEGARSGLGPGARVRFIHHIATPKNVVWHLENFLANGGEIDLIGISWYPVDQGSFPDFRANLLEIANRYHKDIVIAETAYPWTTRNFDAHNNVLKASNPAAGMPSYTPQGQAEFMEKLLSSLRAVPGGHGLGFFWWEATWLPSAPIGSPTDNTNLFDEKGAALPALDALR